MLHQQKLILKSQAHEFISLTFFLFIKQKKASHTSKLRFAVWGFILLFVLWYRHAGG